MTKKNIMSKCTTFVMYISVCVALVTTSLTFDGQPMINYSHQTLRPLFQMLYDHNGLVLLISAFAGLIAININLSISLQQIKDREQSEKKYISASNANTKSRLELTRLQERGY